MNSEKVSIDELFEKIPKNVREFLHCYDLFGKNGFVFYVYQFTMNDNIIIRSYWSQFQSELNWYDLKRPNFELLYMCQCYNANIKLLVDRYIEETGIVITSTHERTNRFIMNNKPKYDEFVEFINKCCGMIGAEHNYHINKNDSRYDHIYETSHSTFDMLQLIKFESPYSSTELLKFRNKSVVYIGYIGKYHGRHLFKFGNTDNFDNRIFKQHKKNYKMFELMYIELCDNNRYIEREFKKAVRIEGVYCKEKVQLNTNSKDIELFCITSSFTLQSAYNIMSNLIENNKTEMQAAHAELDILRRQIEVLQSQD